MESANLLESSLHCCCKCKGLFSVQDDKLKHQINCIGNPMETTCAYFACERKVFLQLYQPDDFLLDGCDPPYWLSKDDSFINHFVKIRVPDIFDPSIFLKNTTQSNTVETDDTNFLLESNINTLEQETEKTNSDVFLDSNKQVDAIEHVKIQNIINKNIEYLKNDNLSTLNTGPNKSASPFNQNQSLPRLLSPIDKHLHLFGDGSKSRIHSPFERSAGFLQDGQSYSSGNFMYSSNPSLPFSCGLSTDLFSTLPPSQDDNQQAFTTNIEEFPTLQYLDLAKKDPFFGQNPGLSQINTKDPFLINAAIKTTERTNSGLQKSQITRSCEDIQSSPILPLQDGNYFSFPSTLDEPTQLDYLDLATLDFLTNPNFINCGTGITKDKVNERDEDFYSEGYLTDAGHSTARSEIATRVNSASNGECVEKGHISAFSKVKKKKLRLKKSKSDIGKKQANATSVNKSFFAGFPNIRDDYFQQSVIKPNDDLISVHPKGSRSLMEASDFRISRKRKPDKTLENTSDLKLTKMKRRSSETRRISKSEKSFNFRETLPYLTEEQNNTVSAVINQSGCIFVKKKRSLSCDEPVVFVNDSELFEDNDLLREHKISEDSAKKMQALAKAKKNEHTTGKLTSVLQLKCIECDFRCKSVIELKNHRVMHAKSEKNEPDASEIAEENSLQIKSMKNSSDSGIPDNNGGSWPRNIGSQANGNKFSDIQKTLNSEEKHSILPTNDNFPSSVYSLEKAGNTTVIQTSTPNSNDRGQLVFGNGFVICDATKNIEASRSKVVSLLHKNVSSITANIADATFKSDELEYSSRSKSFVGQLHADMTDETEQAVLAIEELNTDYENQKDTVVLSLNENTHVIDVTETGTKVTETVTKDVPTQHVFPLEYEVDGEFMSNHKDKVDFIDGRIIDSANVALPVSAYKTDISDNLSTIETIKEEYCSQLRYNSSKSAREDGTNVMISDVSKLRFSEQGQHVFENIEHAKDLYGSAEYITENKEPNADKSFCKVKSNDSAKLNAAVEQTGKHDTVVNMFTKSEFEYKVDHSQSFPLCQEIDVRSPTLPKDIHTKDETNMFIDTDLESSKLEKEHHAIMEHDYSINAKLFAADFKLTTTLNANMDSTKRHVIEWPKCTETMDVAYTTESKGTRSFGVTDSNEKGCDQLENMLSESCVTENRRCSSENMEKTVETIISRENPTVFVAEPVTDNKKYVILEPIQTYSNIIVNPSMHVSTKVAHTTMDGTENDNCALSLTESAHYSVLETCDTKHTQHTEGPTLVGKDISAYTIPENTHCFLSNTGKSEELQSKTEMQGVKVLSDICDVLVPTILPHETPEHITEFRELHADKKSGNLQNVEGNETPNNVEVCEKYNVTLSESNLEAASDKSTVKAQIHISRGHALKTVCTLSGKNFTPNLVASNHAMLRKSMTVLRANDSEPSTEKAIKMKSILGKNAAHVASVAFQHESNGSSCPRQEPGTLDHQYVKSLAGSVNQVCSSEINNCRPVLEMETTQDSEISDKLSDGDVNKGPKQVICNISEMSLTPNLGASNHAMISKSMSVLRANDSEPSTEKAIKMKSILGKNATPVASVAVQHKSNAGSSCLRVPGPPDQQYVKSLVGSVNHVCSSERNNTKPVLEMETSQDSARPDKLSGDDVNKCPKQVVEELDGTYRCIVQGCKFKTVYKRNVSAHYQQVHLALKRYMCDQCTYATPNLSSLKHHLQLNHYNDKRFKCPECDYLSLFHGDVVKHVRHTHRKQKQFACNQCGYRTGHSHSLKLHIMSHNGIRPYKCNACDYRANNSNKVTRHISLCHKDTEGVSCEKIDLTFNIDTKQFQCEAVISQQDIKVIEVSASKANAMMTVQNEKRNMVKQKKNLERQEKEGRKALRTMEKAGEDLKKKSCNAKDETSKDGKVIRLTPEAAIALMETKKETKYSSWESVKFTKILPKSKTVSLKDTPSIETAAIIGKHNMVGKTVELEGKSDNNSIQPCMIKMLISDVVNN